MGKDFTHVKSIELIVGKKISNLIKAKHDTITRFTLLHDMEDEYNKIRCALNGTTKLSIDTAIDILSFIYGQDMAIQKLSEILKSIVEYKED